MKTKFESHRGIEIEVYNAEPEIVAAAIVEKDPYRWDILTTSGYDRQEIVERLKRAIDKFIDAD